MQYYPQHYYGFAVDNEIADEEICAAIGDADLMLEVLMPSRVTKDFNGYANIQELAEYHGTRVRRYLLDAYPNRWDGKLTKNNLTGVQLPNKDTTESKEDSQ